VKLNTLLFNRRVKYFNQKANRQSLAGLILEKLIFRSLIFVTSLLLIFSPPAAADSTEAANIFKKRCSACHTFGKGVKVGPDLKGVTERRKRDWLLKFIYSSQRMIQSGDPTAVALFEQFRHQRMPDWTDLSPQQIEGILDYFAANGPEQKEPDEYPADTATPIQIERGHELFYGVARLTYGGQACINCHSIGAGFGSGGSLGPNLSDAYRRYRDTAMTAFLKHPCFQRAPEAETDNYLTPEEIFSLKAFLAQASGVKAHSVQTQLNPSTIHPEVTHTNRTKRSAL